MAESDETTITVYLSLYEDMGRPGYMETNVSADGPITVETWRSIKYQFRADAERDGVEVIDFSEDEREYIRDVFRANQYKRSEHTTNEDVDIDIHMERPDRIPFEVSEERKEEIRDEVAKEYETIAGPTSWDSGFSFELEIVERESGPVVVDITEVSVSGYATERTANTLKQYGIEPEEYGIRIDGV